MAAPQLPPCGKPHNSTSQSLITADTLTVWAKTGRTHRYPCGGGLYFQTKPISASWVFRFRFGGARKAMGLGAFPEVGLVAARERAGRARVALREGRDPIAERAAARGRFVREASASDGGAGGVLRPPAAQAVPSTVSLTMQQWVHLYGDPDDEQVCRNAQGDMRRIDEILLRSMLMRMLVRAELFRRGFPNAGRVPLVDIPPAFWEFSADPGLPPLMAAKLKLYHQDYLKRGDTATALVLARLAESIARKLWEDVKRRKRPPPGRGGPFDSSRTVYGGKDPRPTVLVDLYRDPDTRPDLLRLLAQASNESETVTLQQARAWLEFAADHECWERQRIVADLLAKLAERATRPDEGTIAEIERRGREALDEGRAADVLREHGLPDKAAVHARQAVKHLWCAQKLAKEWSPNATELVRAVRGELSWQIGGLGHSGGIATKLVAAALNSKPISRFLARPRVKKSKKDRLTQAKSRPSRNTPSAPRRVPERARALLRQQLADGPKPKALIEAAAEAAEIPERSLLAAASALGVRTQRGQWWLEGASRVGEWGSLRAATKSRPKSAASRS